MKLELFTRRRWLEAQLPAARDELVTSTRLSLSPASRPDSSKKFIATLDINKKPAVSGGKHRRRVEVDWDTFSLSLADSQSSKKVLRLPPSSGP
jgi:hypothetical protein